MQPYCVRPPVSGLPGGIIMSALPAFIVRESGGSGGTPSRSDMRMLPTCISICYPWSL